MNLAFYNGLMGIKTQQLGIDVWGHNISNSNLSGYRASRPEFSSLFTSSLSSSTSTSTTSSQIGYGSKLTTKATTRDQGSFSATENTFDLAIDGNGWFGMLNKDGETVYTRNGGFTFDSNRNLVDHTGTYVTGVMAGNIIFSQNPEQNRLTSVVQNLDSGDPDNQTILKLPKNLTYPRQHTDTVTLRGNIGEGDEEVTFSANLISATNEVNNIYITLSKSSVQPDSGTLWNISAVITNEDGSIQFDRKTGSVNFDSSGEITAIDMPELSNDGLPIKLDLGNGRTGLQANNSIETTTSIQKNGQPEGHLNEYSVTKDGDVVAFFDNGYKSIIAKVAIYHFRNEQGLQEIGGSYYAETPNSGEAIFYRNEKGDLITTSGQVYDHTLEEGNINTTEALSELMMLQRAFDANSKSITTGDSLIQTALKMGGN
jgi:flagellar hook protein FlgE